MSIIKLTKGDSVKLLSKGSGLIEKALKDGWKEEKPTKKRKIKTKD